jgi:hypothetical protein
MYYNNNISNSKCQIKHICDYAAFIYRLCEEAWNRIKVGFSDTIGGNPLTQKLEWATALKLM